MLVLAMMGIWLAMFVFLAIIPSWWLYFADGTLKWTGNFHLNLGIRKLTMQQKVLRDLIVVIWYGIALGGFGIAIRVYNRLNPKVLGPGEEKREATGGYK
jgi:hypothetical protein